jgi:hypothetical protein
MQGIVVWSKLLSTLNGIASQALKELMLVSTHGRGTGRSLLHRTRGRASNVCAPLYHTGARIMAVGSPGLHHPFPLGCWRPFSFRGKNRKLTFLFISMNKSEQKCRSTIDPHMMAPSSPNSQYRERRISLGWCTLPRIVNQKTSSSKLCMTKVSI